MSENKIYTQYGSLKATKASKPHECIRCGGSIEKGEVYVVYTDRNLRPGQTFPQHSDLHAKCSQRHIRDEYARDIQRVETGLKRIVRERQK